MQPPRSSRPPVRQPPVQRPRWHVPLLVAVILITAILVTGEIVYWAIQNTTPPCDGNNPFALGAAVGRTSDGENWTITITCSLAGVTPSTTLFALFATNGSTLLPPTLLSSLPGGVVRLNGTAGGLFLQYQGVTPGSISVGDVLRIGTTFAGTTVSATGCEVQITFHNGQVLFQGWLR